MTGNELQVRESGTLEVRNFSAFGNITDFENAQRMARALCSSPMVPDVYRGEANIGSCIIALEMANRIGANVLAVMQNLYIVHGKPAWSSQFLIACVNASGRFSPMRYRMTGEKGADSYGCVAWAQDKAGVTLESPEISVAMAKAEGWFQKNGSKWKTMPELMLRYRAATLFTRLYAPELTMGIRTEDEAHDIIDITPVVTDPVNRLTHSSSPLVSVAPPDATTTPAAKAARVKKAEAEARTTVVTPIREPEVLTPEVKETPPFVTDAAAEAEAGLAPVAEAAAPAPVALTAREQLEECVLSNGFTFSHFQKWAIESQNVPGADACGGFEEIHEVVCKRLMRSEGGMLRALAATKAKMEGK